MSRKELPYSTAFSLHRPSTMEPREKRRRKEVPLGSDSPDSQTSHESSASGASGTSVVSVFYSSDSVDSMGRTREKDPKDSEFICVM